MRLPPTSPMIETRYAGPTDHRGSRVIARNVTSGARKIVPWDYGLDPGENHYLAAQAVLHGGWHIVSRCSVNGGGYLFSTAPEKP